MSEITESELLEIKNRILKNSAEIKLLEKNVASDRVLLRETCPHKEVIETCQKPRGESMIAVATSYYPRRMCICCELTEYRFSGYKKLSSSEVVRIITDEMLAKIRKF
ncbi:hypothetical protein KKG48_02590 [Patescibacteria group bacterium]|nr:hypothetical protein [Patescibacteria group bacterium]MCG2694997.1 hypothetical protein [Candidatus Parcubacteria bacterium]